MRKTTMALLVATLAFPVSALAQGHRGGAQQAESQNAMMGSGSGMMGMCGAMMGHMGPSAALILGQKQALNLSESQIEQLEAIQSEWATGQKAHMDRIEPIRLRSMKALEGDAPDFSEYETALKAMAAEHVKFHVEAARFSQRATQLLDTEQRSNLRYGMRLMHGMMGGGMTSMMSSASCPMMGAMKDPKN